MLRQITLIIGLALTPVTTSAQNCDPDWEPPFDVDPALYPFEHHCIDLGHGILHYVDEGPAQNPVGTALLLHGNPSWSFLYRGVIENLASDGYRVIAPDLYGFGMSDKPDPATFEYSAQAHADVIEQFVTTLDLQDATLVLHDWGGPIGFAMAGRVPTRFTSVVITNTWGFPFTEENSPYFHDAFNWAGQQVRNSEDLLRTGSLPRNVGNLMGALHGPPQSPEYIAVRNGYWGPFLDLTTGLPLGEDEMQPTNRLYFFLGDPAFTAEVTGGVAAMSDRPMAIVDGAQDSLFGALRCDERRGNACPPGTRCARRFGVDVCLDENTGRFMFPMIDEFVGLWDADKVRDVFISPDIGHFVQEIEFDAVADAVRLVRQ